MEFTILPTFWLPDFSAQAILIGATAISRDVHRKCWEVEHVGFIMVELLGEPPTKSSNHAIWVRWGTLPVAGLTRDFILSRNGCFY